MTSKKSKSLISEIDDAVFQYENGQLDPKYHQNFIQTLLDTDYLIELEPAGTFI